MVLLAFVQGRLYFVVEVCCCMERGLFVSVKAEYDQDALE